MSRKQATTDETFLKSHNWCRLTVCLNGPVKNALIAILHNFNKNPNIKALPEDPTKLYNFLVTRQNKLMKLKKEKVLKQDQLNQLLPQEGKVSSKELDITLLRLLIKTFNGILNEDGHWREPRHDDHSIAAAVFRAVNIRNKVFHYSNPISMSDQEFDDIWCQIEKTLLELFYVEDISGYKTHDFDPILCKKFHSNMAEDFENILLAYQQKCKNRDVSEYFVDRNYRNISTYQITSNVNELLKKHDSIMVSGEAGLGKTFSAKKLRYLWASGEILKKKKLLYIDSKRVNRYMYKPSYAAPICVSELGDVFKDKPDEYLESFGCVKKPIKDLVVIIDGVDELSIKENNLDLNFLNKLQVKIDQNNDISAMETIIGIYFGLFFPRSKRIQDQLQQSNLFNKHTRAVLELLPLEENGVKELIFRATCNKISCNCEKCAKTYTSARDVEFRNVPSHLIAMIRIFEYLPDTNFSRITNTKIFIITNSHTSDRARFDHDLLNLFGRFEKCNIIVKHRELNICITKGLGTYITPDIYQYKSKGINIKLSKRYRKYFNFRNSEIPSMRKSDSRTLDLLFNALSISSTAALSEASPVIDCKLLVIQDIDYLNDHLTEKLFSIVLSGVVDFIYIPTFFTDRQLEILKNMESMYTNKLMNIAFSRMNFKYILDLPKVGNRHIYCYAGRWDDKDLIALKRYISPVHCNNFSEYKIIDHIIPFIRKKNYTRDYEKSMYLVLYGANFKKISHEVFADVLSLIPSLAWEDNNDFLSFHWMSLSQKDDCRINELRIWYPQPEKFKYFLNIKTNILQFISECEDDLEELLDHIVKNENVQLNKEIKVFAVKYDEYDWDCYEEKTLFSYKTIEEFKLNHSWNNLQLERYVKKWCCEISLPFQKNSESVPTFSGLETEV